MTLGDMDFVVDGATVDFADTFTTEGLRIQMFPISCRPLATSTHHGLCAPTLRAHMSAVFSIT